MSVLRDEDATGLPAVGSSVTIMFDDEARLARVVAPPPPQPPSTSFFWFKLECPADDRERLIMTVALDYEGVMWMRGWRADEPRTALLAAYTLSEVA